MDFGLSEWLGLIVSVAVVLSMQLKNVRYILVCQLVCNGLGALSYILNGNLSGCGLYGVAILQTIVFFLYRLKNPDKTPFFLALAFLVAFGVCSLATYRIPQDLLSAAAAVSCALGLAQKKASGYRLFMLLNGVLWLLYDVAVSAAMTMMLSHILTVAASLLGIVRLDLLKKERRKA